MKVLVTGCIGRVGRRVVKAALEQGNIVMGVDKASFKDLEGLEDWFFAPNFSYQSADLQNFEEVLAIVRGNEAVINLAARPYPVDYKVVAHNENVVISWNILRACAELGIKFVAQASSVNVFTMAYCSQTRIRYLPIDEAHPCEPDEPYGLSKVICELQADTIVRRYPEMRVASLRLHYSVPSKSVASSRHRVKDLWGYVQEDSAAQAFLLAVQDNEKWGGHERFLIVAPETACEEETASLLEEFLPDIPIKEGRKITGRQSLFDCSKAAALLGWNHEDKET
ncbi:hypothetical protein CVT24_002180 [Panaeolus cyanescens]|uniref:NAD-dependent epimerase/dehydratase domain-containing protein n=1 Tax=Panaeolus cyanescens TaxID=181874 RepID=A0A409YHV6_9AGAR|nr:hypothetical protein CVT24_002180 [Panaeolus cyanescens]